MEVPEMIQLIGGKPDEDNTYSQNRDFTSTMENSTSPF
jgi:hypothetical protein